MIDGTPSTLEQPFSTAIDTRLGDFDLNGHANHISFLSYAETARVRHLASTGLTPRSLVAAGVAVIVLRVEIDYRREVGFDDLVQATSLYRFGDDGKSFRNFSTVLVGDVVAAELTVILGVLDLRLRVLRAHARRLLSSPITEWKLDDV